MERAGQLVEVEGEAMRLVARADLSGLTDSGELDMMRLIAQVPRVIEAAAAAHEPHRLASARACAY
jgi:arginyl-tRNA synthetase